MRRGGYAWIGFWDADLATPLETVQSFLAVGQAKGGPSAILGSRIRRLGSRIERKASRHFAGRIFATLASIGLLLSKNWGRLLSMGYAIYAIVMGIAGGVVSWIYVTAPLLDKMSASSGPDVYGAIGGAIGGTIGSLAGLLYPIAILVFMTRKRVVEYLKRAT